MLVPLRLKSEPRHRRPLCICDTWTLRNSPDDDLLWLNNLNDYYLTCTVSVSLIYRHFWSYSFYYFTSFNRWATAMLEHYLETLSRINLFIMYLFKVYHSFYCTLFVELLSYMDVNKPTACHATLR